MSPRRGGGKRNVGTTSVPPNLNNDNITAATSSSASSGDGIFGRGSNDWKDSESDVQELEHSASTWWGWLERRGRGFMGADMSDDALWYPV